MLGFTAKNDFDVVLFDKVMIGERSLQSMTTLNMTPNKKNSRGISPFSDGKTRNFGNRALSKKLLKTYLQYT